MAIAKKRNKGGRPKKQIKCAACKGVFGSREMIGHLSSCPKRNK